MWSGPGDAGAWSPLRELPALLGSGRARAGGGNFNSWAPAFAGATEWAYGAGAAGVTTSIG